MSVDRLRALTIAGTSFLGETGCLRSSESRDSGLDLVDSSLDAATGDASTDAAIDRDARGLACYPLEVRIGHRSTENLN